MTDCPTHFDVDADASLERSIKNALATLAARDPSDIDRDTITQTFDSALTDEYHKQLAPIKTALENAREAGNPIAVETYEAALDAAKDSLRSMFAAGHSRLNRALDAVEAGTITYQLPSADELVLVSHKTDRENSRYTFDRAVDEGHSECSCPDKTENDDCPVCKHELAWLIYQATNPLLTDVDPAVAHIAAGEHAVPKTDAAPVAE